MKTKTIRLTLLMMSLILCGPIFQSCDLSELFEDPEEEEYHFSYSNEMGGTTTEYGTTTWSTLSKGSNFISQFGELGNELNYAKISNGVRDGNRVEEVYFDRATTDDEASEYFKKMADDGFVFSWNSGSFVGYKVDSDGVKYELEYYQNSFSYRKTEYSSLKKDDVLKRYNEDLKKSSHSRVYVNWAQVKKETPWIQVFPTVEEIFSLCQTDSTGNEISLYAPMSYQFFYDLSDRLKEAGFDDSGYGASYAKEVNGNEYVMTIDYDGCITMKRVLSGNNDGTNDYPDNPDDNGEDNPDDNGEDNPDDNGEENGNENEGGNQSSSVEDFDGDGKINWQDKFYKLVVDNGVSIKSQKTYSSGIDLYYFTSSQGAIQIYDSTAGYDGDRYYYDLSVKGGAMCQYEKGVWRYVSVFFKDRNKPADEGFKSGFSLAIFGSNTSWDKAYFYMKNMTKVGSVTYVGRECTEYTYSGATYYIDNETEMCLYYEQGDLKYETLEFTIGAKLSVPEYRRIEMNLPKNVKITTSDKLNENWKPNILTIIKLGNEWMCSTVDSVYTYWKFDDNGTMLKSMTKYYDGEWTSESSENKWQDFDEFAQKCGFDFIFSNSTPKGTCYKDCDPTGETIEVCGFECEKYTDGIEHEFYVNNDNNVVYKANTYSLCEIIGWDTSVSSFEIPVP